MTGQDRYRINQFILAAFGGPHRVGKIRFDDNRQFGYAEFTVLMDSLATFDADTLTRIVFAAHDWCVRIEFANGGPRRVKLRVHPRHARDGSMHERHPTLQAAVDTWRRHHNIEDGL